MPNYFLILFCGISERGSVILCMFNCRKVYLSLQNHKGVRCKESLSIFNPILKKVSSRTPCFQGHPKEISRGTLFTLYYAKKAHFSKVFKPTNAIIAYFVSPLYTETSRYYSHFLKVKVGNRFRFFVLSDIETDSINKMNLAYER